MQRNNHADEKLLSTEDIKEIEWYMNKFIFSSISNRVMYYYCLTYINISKNNICALPKKFGTCFKLKTLNISDNNLGIYDNYNWFWLEQIGIKNELMTLNLSKNSVSYIIQLILLD